MAEAGTPGGRKIAFDVLLRVTRGGAWSGLALDSALRERPDLERREKALATELVYGTLRRSLSLDAALAASSSRPLSEMEDRVLVLLRLGAYQILYMRVPDHAAVSATVDLAREVGVGGASGFVNGVLRALTRAKPPEPPSLKDDPKLRLLLTEALPSWVFDELAKELPLEEVEELARAFNQPASTMLRAPSSEERELAIEKLEEAGVEAERTALSSVGIVLGSQGFHPEQLPGWDSLGLQTQDEGAQLVGEYALLPSSRAAGWRPRRILDACAGPGGKTCHLGQAVPEAKIVAVDLHRRRAARVLEEASRLGMGSRVQVQAADATKPLPFAEPKSFDLVLVDAPCTGLGTLRRHPEIKLTRSAEDIPRLADLQGRLLASLADYVAPGGRLVYAVCTVTRAEGPEVVARFLSSREDFEPDPPEVSGTGEGAAPPWGELLDHGGALRLWTHRHGTDSFYAARLHRRK